MVNQNYSGLNPKRQSNLLKLLILLSAYCLLLLTFRIWMTRSILYGFLVWNLILAYIPLGISKIMFKKNLNKPMLVMSLFIWLLFLPNAPYIITDIFHLKKQTSMAIWFDLLLVISFAFNGIVLFFLSVHDFYNILLKHLSEAKTLSITTLIFFLTGFGVYLGRFLRFNSWDILSNPNILIADILEIFLNPVSHPRAWGFTLGFGTLLLIGFLIFKILASPDKEVISIYK